jgi:ATP-dependent Lon protease
MLGTDDLFIQVIKESAELALSWVKTHAYDLGITNKRAQDPLRIPEASIDVHLHLPAGAQKKDGPSAGIAMVRVNFSFKSYCSTEGGWVTRSARSYHS